MSKSSRIFVIILGSLLTFFSLSAIITFLPNQDMISSFNSIWVKGPISIGSGFYFWLAKDEQVKFSLRVSLIVGIIGFLAGFIGPIIFTPDSNQGPLLGLFITGPAGLLAGFYTGMIISFLERDPVMTFNP